MAAGYGAGMSAETAAARGHTRQRRLAAHKLDHPARRVSEVRPLLCGLQDAGMGTAHTSLALRWTGADAVMDAVEEGSLLTAMSLRGAPHLHRADDLGTVRAAMTITSRRDLESVCGDLSDEAVMGGRKRLRGDARAVGHACCPPVTPGCAGRTGRGCWVGTPTAAARCSGLSARRESSWWTARSSASGGSTKGQDLVGRGPAVGADGPPGRARSRPTRGRRGPWAGCVLVDQLSATAASRAASAEFRSPGSPRRARETGPTTQSAP